LIKSTADNVRGMMKASIHATPAYNLLAHLKRLVMALKDSA